MGKLEKVIVLSVLAVIAVILVISLTLDDPLKKEKVVMAGSSATKTPGSEAVGKAALDERAAMKDRAIAPAVGAASVPPKVEPSIQPQGKPPELVKATPPTLAPGSAPTTLLSTTVAAPKQEDSGVVHPAATSPGIPQGSMLKSTDGLQESYLADMRFYTWQTGDTFRSIAVKYYGDPAKFTMLRRSNEGRENVQAGEKILVPVFDMDAPRPNEAALAVAPTPAAATTPASAKPAVQPKDTTATKAAPTKVADTSGGPRLHVVKDGESLWKIANVELGDGGRWKEIFEANRDVLSKPEAVHVGLKLRIPVK